jgi:hypothetical protein
VLIDSFSPGSTGGVLLEQLEAVDVLANVHTREKSSSSHSSASDTKSSEAQKQDSATTPSAKPPLDAQEKPVATGDSERVVEEESSYDGNITRDFRDGGTAMKRKKILRDGKQPQAMRKLRKSIDDHSPYDENITRHFGYTGTEVPREDPMKVDWKSSISKYGEWPWDLQDVKISLSRQKLGTLMYMGNALRYRRWVTPIQRIETLAPSYPYVCLQ